MRLSLLLFLCATSSWAQSDKKFGALAAPAMLRSGQTALFGFLGAPEAGVGFRQGIGGLELQAQWKVDFLEVSTSAEGLAKFSVYHQGLWRVALGTGVAAVLNSGSTYLQRRNEKYFGVQPKLQGVATYQWAETAYAVAQVDVPVTFSLQPEGLRRFSPLCGGGVELYLAEGISALALAQAGIDVVRLTNQAAYTQFLWQFRMGLGWRLF